MNTRPSSAHPRIPSGQNADSSISFSNVDTAEALPGVKSQGGFSKRVGALKAKERTYNANMLSKKIKEANSERSSAPVTVMGFEAHSYIRDQNRDSTSSVRRSSLSGNSQAEVGPPNEPEKGEISSADAFRINAFRRLKTMKGNLFEDPSLQDEMRKKRGYKDNKIVANLAGLRAGFVRNKRSNNLRTMESDAKALLLGRNNSDFMPTHRPKFVDFSKIAEFSSKIEKIPRYVLLLILI